jgi:wobble nucleotide-excising tRNase
MIKKIKIIKNLAVFKDFEWDKCVFGVDMSIKEFTKNNIIYGRNYSGKTTLSKIVRALEHGELSDKYGDFKFTVEIDPLISVDQTNFSTNMQNVRVFNEDFVLKNLHFVSNPNEGIEPFAVLGEDNAKIEGQIQTLKDELGNNDEGSESNLYKDQKTATEKSEAAKKAHTLAVKELDDALTKKATDRTTGIKYKAQLYGDQNYDKSKLENDILRVQSDEYEVITTVERLKLANLTEEKALSKIDKVTPPVLSITSLLATVKGLVEKKVGESGKIDLLTKNALLNRWVQEGMHHHAKDHSVCVFCGNNISQTRWNELEKHFDEESKKLESELAATKTLLEAEKAKVDNIKLDDDRRFYSEFHGALTEIRKSVAVEVKKYKDDIDGLIKQIEERQSSILIALVYAPLSNTNYALSADLTKYNKEVVDKTNEYTSSLETKKNEARAKLRLDTVSDFVKTFGYAAKIEAISNLLTQMTDADSELGVVVDKIKEKLKDIANKQKELEDESKGAKKVDEYLNHFFGHKYLSLEAITEGEDENKKVRFEIQRDGKKAYHLSEGEKSLIAFCYFIAKLEDTDTKNSKPIIWVDDPISSLDQNHIYFIYGLLKAKVIDSGVSSQLFVSTHNLDFLRHLINTKGLDNKHTSHFIIERHEDESKIRLMPDYMKRYVTEFNYIFGQIYKCGTLQSVDDNNYKEFYGFANNARKFLEMYLYYQYPGEKSEDAMNEFFSDDTVTKNLIYKLDNDNSHADRLETGGLPYDIAETHKAAQKILEILKKNDKQYASLLKSIGIEE